MYKIAVSKNTIEIRNQTTNELYRKISEISSCEVFSENSILKIQSFNFSYDVYFAKVMTLSINGGAFLPVTNFNDFCNTFATTVVIAKDGSGTSTTPTMPTNPINLYPNMYTPFTNLVNFTGFPLVMEQKQISAPLTITPNTTGALPGASVLMRFIADGVQANAPIFANCQQVTGSSGWDNRAGIVNLVQMQFDGVDFFFSVFQTAIGAVLDLQAPALVSSAINAAGTIVTLTFNEDLLATSLPIAANFTGATVTSATILNNVVTLNISPAKAAGTTFNLVYSGTTIKDLASNSAAGFTTALTVAAATTITPVNLDSRQAGIDQVSVGIYKKNLGGWRVALSSTLNFVGDKTFETSDASLAGTGLIIGLDTRLVADANIAYTNVKYWIGYYGGSYKAATNGNQTGALAGYIAGDRMKLQRTGTNLVAKLKRNDGTVIDLFTWTGVTEPLSTLTIIDDNAAQVSLIIL